MEEDGRTLGRGDLPFAVWNDLDAILEPSDFGVIFLDFDFKFAMIILNTVFSLELTGELVGKFYGEKSKRSI